MNGLHPIIRRKRRPLYVEDAPPMPTNSKAAQPVAIVPLVKHPEKTDAKITAPSEAK